MKIIDSRHDRWQAAPAADGPLPGPRPHLLLTPAQWLAVRAHWPAGLVTGLALPNDAAVEDFAADLPRLALIALDFPQWTDGRAYSQARLLRRRLRFAGGLRAGGAVLVDMLPLLQRSGFDSARLRVGQGPAAARRALGFFESYYQGDAQQPQPRFALAASIAGGASIAGAASISSAAAP